jgi:hypothetical protein
MAIRKRTNNDLQNTTQKTKDQVTRTPLKTGDELRYSGRVSSSCSTSGTHRVTLETNTVISLESFLLRGGSVSFSIHEIRIYVIRPPQPVEAYC